MGNLSKNFNIADFFKEGKKVQDMACFHVPDIYQRILKKLVKPILQPLRDFLGAPVFVTSGYRSDAHNAKIGGNPHSHHLFGGPDKSAVDIWTEHLDIAWEWLKKNKKLFCYAYMDIKNPKKNEHWIHISGLSENDRRVGIMWVDGPGGRSCPPEDDGRKVA